MCEFIHQTQGKPKVFQDSANETQRCMTWYTCPEGNDMVNVWRSVNIKQRKTMSTNVDICALCSEEGEPPNDVFY